MNIKTRVESLVSKTLKDKIKIPKQKKILVALSGGKDSAVMAYLLKKNGYDVSGFHIDLKLGGYSERCKGAVVELCEMLGIGLHIYDMKKEMGSGMCYLRQNVQDKEGYKGVKNCAVCGVIKKWIINKESRKFKIDFVATGHNLDDECQTFLLNVFKGSPELSANSGAITRNVSDKKFIPRIKPLFYVLEEMVREYAKVMKLPFVPEKCPCALDSYRIQIREFLNTIDNKTKENIIKNFERIYPKIAKMKSSAGIQYCEKCGEPSRGKVCKVCEMVK